MARILVIDHDASIRHLLRAVLEDEGFTVVAAHNGYQGLRHDPAEPVFVWVFGFRCASPARLLKTCPGRQEVMYAC